jgi:hypothetical protein
VNLAKTEELEGGSLGHVGRKTKVASNVEKYLMASHRLGGTRKAALIL